jgi:hypothetical protein
VIAGSQAHDVWRWRWIGGCTVAVHRDSENGIARIGQRVCTGGWDSEDGTASLVTMGKNEVDIGKNEVGRWKT